MKTIVKLGLAGILFVSSQVHASKLDSSYFLYGAESKIGKITAPSSNFDMLAKLSSSKSVSPTSLVAEYDSKIEAHKVNSANASECYSVPKKYQKRIVLIDMLGRKFTPVEICTKKEISKNLLKRILEGYALGTETGGVPEDKEVSQLEMSVMYKQIIPKKKYNYGRRGIHR